ncbi:MAG: putative 2-aminoethylphosphonate ABC transporter ATP-binding protein [Hyphomicrobiales bacterium]
MTGDRKSGDNGGTAFLAIADLVKKFGEFVALDGISLEIGDGEFVCFLGPSGCGKTTLLRAIAGLDYHTSGKIWQAGKEISNLPPSSRDFGIVFQSYALFPNLTVKANVAYGLESEGRKRQAIDARVTELLNLVSLPDQADKYPAQLSGGQQQRIALARAIATSPGLLLLDEPLSALDAKVRVHLRREIKELQRRLGVTTIMVTHDQEEALYMADRIVVMNQGVIDQVGTPLEIYREPATAFVADFIGRMNFMDASVVGKDKVAIGQARLDCDTRDYEKGAAVQLAIRPESIVVEELAEKSATDTNLVETTIEALEFMGSIYHAKLSSAKLAGQSFAGEFSINMVNRTGVKIGDKVRVALPPASLLLFPAQS